MTHARGMAAAGAVIVLDDVTNTDIFGGPLRAWQEFLAAGYVIPAVEPLPGLTGDLAAPPPPAAVPGTTGSGEGRCSPAIGWFA